MPASVLLAAEECLLRPQRIALDIDVQSKAEVLDAAAKALQGSCRVHAEPIFRALQRREQAASTAVGDGLAVPHARIHGIDEPVTMYLRTASPIRFGSPDGKPVSEFFVILVPAEGAVETHLQLLRAVAELFSDPAFRATLAAAKSLPTVADAFARWTDRAGASDLAPLQGLA